VSQAKADCKTVVNAEGNYIEVSDSFCELVGYRREEIIGKRYSDFTVKEAIDIPTVFDMFVKEGYMQGLWLLAHHDGDSILVSYESWFRPDGLIESRMGLVGEVA
jgi:PAS domain S-box-containing protein